MKKFQEDYLPKDDIYLNHIESIRIGHGESDETKNLYFCLTEESFINFKNNKPEKIGYFTIIFL